MFCTDFRRGRRYGELLEAKGEGKQRQVDFNKYYALPISKTLKILCKQGTAPCYKAVQYLQGS